MSATREAFALVAVAVPVRRSFTYRVPEELRERVAVGSRVRVVFSRRRLVGTVVAFPAPEPDLPLTILPIEGILDGAPPLDAELMELTRFVADYYLCSWGEAIEAALPPAARSRPKPPAPGAAPEPPDPPIEPTPAQRDALAKILPAIERRAFEPFLVYGATGSGKTEVYLRAAEASLAAGRGVLYLVPEIGLTPLLVARLRRRFPGRVAVLHSGLAAGARRDAWEGVRSGAFPVVVGARSAVFAPAREIGLVIVDEEQDGSYKQEDAPRYNGRDLALVRARRAGAVVLLGSATPSLESFQHARSGRYRLIRLGGRVAGRPLARVEVVDMRREFRERGEVKPLSRLLVAALERCLANGEQAIVLRNRRGWASALLCAVCGERVGCTSCAVAMTWHRAERRLRCHWCAREIPVPRCCPRCGAEELRPVGEGTERIEDELRAALPAARVARLDRDAVRRRGAHEELLRRFAAREIDLLIGTQMVAKGHDFPNVTVVGVLSADQSLGLPDFRAGERTFQLLTQVAGRAGRGEQPGLVIVQAFDPAHPVVLEAAAQDYDAFFEREILYRRALRYPPLSALVQLIVSDPVEANAWRWAQRVGDALRSEDPRLIFGGPGPAPISRLKGKYRQQILVRAAGRRRLVETVDRALDGLGKEVPRRAVHVDVDPFDLL